MRLGLRREAKRHAAFIRLKATSNLKVFHPLESGVAAALCHRSPNKTPKADAFHRVESFPLLGTGKLDLRGAKEMAATFAGTE